MRKFAVPVILTSALLSACGSRPQGETSGPLDTGSAEFALSQTDYKLVASFDILKDGTDSTATLAAQEDSGASQTVKLPIGSFTMDLIGGNYDEVLPAYTSDQGGAGSAPYCVYTGPNVATLGPLTGCTVEGYNPDPFTVQANTTTDVLITVTFHFDEDVTVYFSTGRAKFDLDPQDEQYCGATGIVCAADEVCTVFDDAAPPTCVRECNDDTDCDSGQSCVLADLLGGDGTGVTAQGLCR